MRSGYSYAIHTMGCKLNFYDSECIGSALEDHGWHRESRLLDADMAILNTCTVTNNADVECRNLIRKYRRQKPGGFLVVTGCYAQAEGARLNAMEEVDLVTNNVNKYHVQPLLDAFHGAGLVPEQPHDIMEKRPAEFRILEKFEAKTRAFIKIQDGCNLRCAYCIIPFVRGNNRSVPIEAVLDQLRVLEQQGIEEAVLTGIHIGTWGRDFRPRRHLTDLLEAIETSEINMWIRISSLDSPEIPDEMIRLMQHSRKIVPHLHVPLQAGDDNVLRRMRRIYDTAQFRQRIERLRAEIPHICLGADVIVGFPGESDEDFARTEQFLSEIPMDYLHVFSYSNRAGTAAASFPDQVNGRVIKNRSRILRAFSEQRRTEHYARFVGHRRWGIVLPKSLYGCSRSVLTDNYIELGIDVPEQLVGQRVEVEILQRDSRWLAQPVVRENAVSA